MLGEILGPTLGTDASSTVIIDRKGAGHAVGSSQTNVGQPDLSSGVRRVSYIKPEAMESFRRIAEERGVPVGDVIAEWNQTIL